MDISKSTGINTYILKNIQTKKTVKEENKEVIEEKTTEKTQITKKQIPANDVLTFMANQSMCMKPDFVKNINVAKFADEEQYSRIGNMMREFEASVENGLKTFDGEFPNVKISERLKMYTVLNSLEKTGI